MNLMIQLVAYDNSNTFRQIISLVCLTTLSSLLFACQLHFPVETNFYRHLRVHFPITFSSVQFIRSVVSDSLQPHESQHVRPPCYSHFLETTPKLINTENC